MLWYDPHMWVEHRHKCHCYSQLDCRSRSYEEIGCGLPDFQNKGIVQGRMEQHMVRGREVHWIGSKHKQTAFEYGDDFPSGRCSNDYHMPDYCSRAIISELSSVYDGTHRIARLGAGAKVLFKTKSDHCSKDVSIAASKYEKLLSETPTQKACWNFAYDWRQMWCTKYYRCYCEHSDGDCESEDKIQCCRDMYQLFLDEHPELSRFFSGGRISSETAVTRFSIEVQKQSHDGKDLIWSPTWLRLASRSKPIGTLPKVFLEYGHGRTFHRPTTIDLCKEHHVTMSDSDKEFTIAQEDMEYHFRLEHDNSARLLLLPPKTAREVVRFVQQATNNNCP